MNSTNLSLKDVVRCAVNALEAGADSKEEAISSILDFINENYVQNNKLEELPVEVFEVTDKEGNKIEVAGVRFEHLVA